MADMAAGIDMSDKNAWDDSFLINSWNDAVKEYDKYHSIHKSGKRLEEALSEEELKELRADYGHLIEEQESTSDVPLELDDSPDDNDPGLTSAETNGVEQGGQEVAQQLELNASEQQQPAQPASAQIPELHDGARASAMPQAILGTVRDENLKNLMMSWYYAGYYTGLYTGQQQAPSADQAKQQ